PNAGEAYRPCIGPVVESSNFSPCLIARHRAKNLVEPLGRWRVDCCNRGCNPLRPLADRAIRDHRGESPRARTRDAACNLYDDTRHCACLSSYRDLGTRWSLDRLAPAHRRHCSAHCAVSRGVSRQHYFSVLVISIVYFHASPDIWLSPLMIL